MDKSLHRLTSLHSPRQTLPSQILRPTKSTMGSPMFMSLPVEIRRMIYRQVHPEEIEVECCPYRFKLPRPNESRCSSTIGTISKELINTDNQRLPLLLTSKCIHAELHDTTYVFKMCSAMCVYKWVLLRSDRAANKVRAIKVGKECQNFRTVKNASLQTFDREMAS